MKNESNGIVLCLKNDMISRQEIHISGNITIRQQQGWIRNSRNQSAQFIHRSHLKHIMFFFVAAKQTTYLSVRWSVHNSYVKMQISLFGELVFSRMEC